MGAVSKRNPLTSGIVIAVVVRLDLALLHYLFYISATMSESDLMTAAIAYFKSVGTYDFATDACTAGTCDPYKIVRY